MYEYNFYSTLLTDLEKKYYIVAWEFPSSHSYSLFDRFYKDIVFIQSSTTPMLIAIFTIFPNDLIDHLRDSVGYPNCRLIVSSEVRNSKDAMRIPRCYNAKLKSSHCFTTLTFHPSLLVLKILINSAMLSQCV
ncbi:hypothetical protein T4D_2317 [Trichinella pseudospiralis]|uniref:Uncharacterized protein n=1 Tax=Trichinella pseudospiralis TaxID=6337 RepID=A0A0V1F9U5_TRIPS|nr:hypothetical protein T4D_2317 [Trichinella pseudospiralis]